MKHCIAISLLLASMAGCCTSYYCNPQQLSEAARGVANEQQQAIDSSGDNFRAVGAYLVADFQNCGDKIAGDCAKIYQGTSSASSNLQKVPTAIVGQAEKGSYDTWLNIKNAFKVVCLCID